MLLRVMDMLYASFKRSTLAAVFAALLLILLIVSRAQGCIPYKDGDTNKKRLSFISSLRLGQCDTTPTEKAITVPTVFSGAYESYNGIQKAAGYDLSTYKGRKATLYTYALSNGDYTVNLIVLNGRIIGGDISDAEYGGDILPLKCYGKDKA